MNFLYPDHLGELNRQKIERDRLYILKEERIKSESQVTQVMDRLGSWMVTQGMKLRRKYTSFEHAQTSIFIHDESKILRA
jgi:hypothetical protein